MMRQIALWLIILSYTLSGVGCYLPHVASLRPETSVAMVAERHETDCACNQCPGAKACCCRPTQSPTQAAVMTARCDSPLSITLTGKFKPPVTLAIFAALLEFSAPQIPFSTLDASLNSRLPEPSERPPLFA